MAELSVSKKQIIDKNYVSYTNKKNRNDVYIVGIINFPLFQLGVTMGILNLELIRTGRYCISKP